MVPNSEESNWASGSEQASLKSPRTNRGKTTPTKSSLNVEKDTEEYRKLRDRNNEAVKKSRTRTKMRTQNTLDKGSVLFIIHIYLQYILMFFSSGEIERRKHQA